MLGKTKTATNTQTHKHKTHTHRYSHLDSEVVQDCNQVETNLPHGWEDKVGGEVFSSRLLSRKGHVKEDTPGGKQQLATSKLLQPILRLPILKSVIHQNWQSRSYKLDHFSFLKMINHQPANLLLKLDETHDTVTATHQS